MILFGICTKCRNSNNVKVGTRQERIITKMLEEIWLRRPVWGLCPDIDKPKHPHKRLT